MKGSKVKTSAGLVSKNYWSFSTVHPSNQNKYLQYFDKINMQHSISFFLNDFSAQIKFHIDNDLVSYTSNNSTFVSNEFIGKFRKRLVTENFSQYFRDIFILLSKNKCQKDKIMQSKKSKVLSFTVFKLVQILSFHVQNLSHVQVRSSY